MQNIKGTHTSDGPVLTPKLFEAFSHFITSQLGIKMPAGKRTMLQSRLQKRLRHLNLSSFEDYYAFVFKSPAREQELIHLMDVVTTNKTEFYREPRHYEVLVQTVIPELLRRKGIGIHRPLKIWSAGCSTGAEPYTLAMVLSELETRVEGLVFRILATDICTRVLDIGRKAIYEESDSHPIPPGIKKKYLLRSKDRERPRIRIAPEIRRLVEFRRLNLMEHDYGMPASMDIVLCRNVIIYFDRATQHAVLERICRCLKPCGYLFMGHSETLNGLDLPLRQIQANVYQKKPDA
ncbi:MAG: methyltransferase domain-containing protein [Desulfobacteraceae bacterium]|nr:MAG: methyltransferase domain-containing protein [Desulfobacteraceae bacterium]